jgi:hypothetical protein
MGATTVEEALGAPVEGAMSVLVLVARPSGGGRGRDCRSREGRSGHRSEHRSRGRCHDIGGDRRQGGRHTKLMDGNRGSCLHALER